MRAPFEKRSIPVPLLLVFAASVLSLFPGTYGHKLVGDEFHRGSMIVGGLFAGGLAALCSFLATPPEPSAPRSDSSESEREQRERAAHCASMEMHRANMARHQTRMETAEVDQKRVRQIIPREQREQVPAPHQRAGEIAIDAEHLRDFPPGAIDPCVR